MPLLAWRPLLRQCGLPTAETLVTNDLDESRDFSRRVEAGGVVLTPLTGGAGYLVSEDSDWRGLAALQERMPVCLTEPHGAPRAACVIAGRVVWDSRPEPQAAAFEPHLRRFGEATGLDLVEVAVAPVRDGLAVVAADAWVQLEHFSLPARDRILGALFERLTQSSEPTV
jgi:hypothetical protein